MENEVMIRAEGLTKEYVTGEIGSTTLQHELQSWWSRRRGLPDPNQRLDGQAGERGKHFLAVDHVNLEIFRGETVGVIGENGAGKSTLFKLLSRITAPTSGKVTLYGRISSMLEVGAGFDGEMTGRENIYLNGAILGMTKAEIDARLDEIIRFSELEEFIDTPVKRYSSGMYMKLGFAVAAHLDSEILLMDEVLAVGDAAFQNKCIDRMKMVSGREGRTVLCVSHNMNQIRRLCSRCIVLRHGKLIYDGDVSRAIEIYMNEALETEKTCLDYRGLPRPSWLKERRMRMTRAQYLNLSSTYCSGDRKPVIRLNWECYEPVPGLSLRVECKDPSDQRLGTYVIYDICDCRPGRSYQMDLELDISLFAQGSYRTVYCFFVRDMYGTGQNTDRMPGLSLNIEGNAQPGRLQWDAREWGSLELPGASVLTVEEKETGTC